jgi:hypothetical protein
MRDGMDNMQANALAMRAFSFCLISWNCHLSPPPFPCSLPRRPGKPFLPTGHVMYRNNGALRATPLRLRTPFMGRKPCRLNCCAFFPCHHVTARAHKTVPRKSRISPGCTPERLTALYHQLQGVIPLLRDLVQSGTVEEQPVRSAPGSAPSSDAGPRYRCEKRGKGSWTVLDSRQGDALLALTQ